MSSSDDTSKVLQSNAWSTVVRPRSVHVVVEVYLIPQSGATVRDPTVVPCT